MSLATVWHKVADLSCFRDKVFKCYMLYQYRIYIENIEALQELIVNFLLHFKFCLFGAIEVEKYGSLAHGVLR